MSLRSKVLLTIISTSTSLFVLSLGFMVFLFYKDLNNDIDNTYKTIYNLYKTLAESSVGNHNYEAEVELKNCERKRGYFLEVDALYVGSLERKGGKCVFRGRKVNEVLRAISEIHDAVYLLVYYRETVESLKERGSPDFFDRFLKKRKLIGNYVVEGTYIPQILKSLEKIRGYDIVGGFTDKKLVIEYPIIDIKDMPLGRIVFVKDISTAFNRFFANVGIFGAYNLILIGILSLVFYALFNKILSDVYLLEKLASEFQAGKFEHISLLSKKIKRGNGDEMERLKRAVYIMASELEDLINQLKKDKEKLEEIAYKDPLTGLYNRRFFLEHAKALFEHAKRYSSPLSVLLMDIDNFKRINDTYGHDVGDMVIQRLAEVIKSTSRGSDIPARWGGEEFILLLPSTDTKGAKLVAERVRNLFKNSRLKVGNEQVGTTVSIGVSEYRGQEKLEQLLKEADEALYTAKRSGKDRVEVYTSE